MALMADTGHLWGGAPGMHGPKLARPWGLHQPAGWLPQACMAARGFKVLIADESHAMRTSNHAPDARHTEAVAAAARRAQRVMLLSGTPSLSKPFDLFRQVGNEAGLHSKPCGTCLVAHDRPALRCAAPGACTIGAGLARQPCLRLSAVATARR